MQLNNITFSVTHSAGSAPSRSVKFTCVILSAAALWCSSHHHRHWWLQQQKSHNMELLNLSFSSHLCPLCTVNISATRLLCLMSRSPRTGRLGLTERSDKVLFGGDTCFCSVFFLLFMSEMESSQWHHFSGIQGGSWRSYKSTGRHKAVNQSPHKWSSSVLTSFPFEGHLE